MNIVWNGFCFSSPNSGIFTTSLEIFKSIQTSTELKSLDSVAIRPKSFSEIRQLDQRRCHYSFWGNNLKTQIFWLKFISSHWRNFFLREYKKVLIHGLSNFDVFKGRKDDIRVLTIHDLIPILKNPNPGPTSYAYAFKCMLEHALGFTDFIITPSLTTKNIILETYPQLKIPIQAIAYGHDHFPRCFVFDKSQKKITLLYVARYEPYKRLDIFLEIVRRLLPSHNIQGILVTNPEGLKFVAETTPELLANQSFKIYSGIKLEDLIKLYKKSDIFIMPSEMEGFGVPNIEALINGCEVIAREESPFEEYLGASSRMFGNFVPANASIDDWVAKTEYVIKYRIRGDLHERKECLDQFFGAKQTWANYGKDLIKTYQKLF